MTCVVVPPAAIVLAVIGFFVFFLGLLFLLVKEESAYVPTNTVRFTEPHGRALVVTL
jgi:hypothetical protein